MAKNFDERLREIKTIYQKLNNLGVTTEICPELKKFKDVCNDFVKSGIGSSGNIKLKEIERNLVYVLSMQSHIVSSVSLKPFKN